RPQFSDSSTARLRLCSPTSLKRRNRYFARSYPASAPHVRSKTPLATRTARSTSATAAMATSVSTDSSAGLTMAVVGPSTLTPPSMYDPYRGARAATVGDSREVVYRRLGTSPPKTVVGAARGICAPSPQQVAQQPRGAQAEQ